MSKSEEIVFENAKFGQVSVDRSSVLTFPHGLPGFESAREFGLVEVAEETPFVLLLSIEEPRVGFVLVDPTLIWPDYDPVITEEDLNGLAVTEASQLAVYCIVTLSTVPEQVTANLGGPVCINTAAMLAKQMILVDERYHTKHPLLKPVESE
jgi:flagellar assembly factor FliW